MPLAVHPSRTAWTLSQLFDASPAGRVTGFAVPAPNSGYVCESKTVTEGLPNATRELKTTSVRTPPMVKESVLLTLSPRRARQNPG